MTLEKYFIFLELIKEEFAHFSILGLMCLSISLTESEVFYLQPRSKVSAIDA